MTVPPEPGAADRPDADPAPTDPAPTTPDPTSPPAVPPTPDLGWTPPTTPAPSPGRRTSGRAKAAVGIVAAIGAAVGGKFLLGFLAASVAGTAIASLFGGPWEKLPSEIRSAYEDRIEAAVGNRVDGLSDQEAGERIAGWVTSGYLRLDDDQLIRRLELQTAALERADLATCAGFGRSSLKGEVAPDEVGLGLVGSLEQAGTVEWIGLNVTAIEAEMKGQPAQRRVSENEANAAFMDLFGRLTKADVEELTTIGAGTPDADVCGAVRQLYAAALTLDRAQLEVIARYDIQP